LISRCWRLSRSYSTRELESLCKKLDDYSLLKPGDILNKHNAHVLLFERFTDASKTRILAYQTGSPPTWKVLRHTVPVTYLQERGYAPLRYRNIRD
jgi:hypothetical protein